MKPPQKLWPLFTLLLILILLLTACNKGAETAEITVTVPATEETTSEQNNTSDSKPTIVLAAATAPNTTTTAAPIENVDSTATPNASATAQLTATADPIESVDSTATPNATPTPTTANASPELRVFVTPKSRTQWRAGSGELFIPFDNGIKNFQYYLYVPEHWYGVFEMRQETDDIFLFNYIGDPDKKQEVFRVQAFPEHIWASKKEAAGDEGIEFYSLRNVTFVYICDLREPFFRRGSRAVPTDDR